MRWITRTVQGCLAIAHGDLKRGEDSASTMGLLTWGET